MKNWTCFRIAAWVPFSLLLSGALMAAPVKEVPIVRQITGSSCGLGALSNALLTWDPNLKMSQEEWLYHRLEKTPWYENLIDGGNGLTLEQLNDLGLFMLDFLNVRGAKTEHFRLPEEGSEEIPPSPAVFAQIRQMLGSAFHSRGKNAVIAEVRTGIITPRKKSRHTRSGGVGHFVNIRDYDPIRDRVRIADSYPAFPEDYWVNLDLFLSAVNTEDDDIPHVRKGFLLLELP